MKQEEILQKAIEKAVEGGWKRGMLQLGILEEIEKITVESEDKE